MEVSIALVYCQVAARKVNRCKEQIDDNYLEVSYLLSATPDRYFLLYKMIYGDSYKGKKYDSEVLEVLNQINIDIISELDDSDIEELKTCIHDPNSLKNSNVYSILKDEYSSLLRCWKLLVEPTEENMKCCFENLDKLPKKLLTRLKELYSFNLYNKKRVKTLQDNPKLMGSLNLKELARDFPKEENPYDTISDFCPEFLKIKYDLKQNDIDAIEEVLKENGYRLSENPFNALSIRVQNQLFRAGLYDFPTLIKFYDNGHKIRYIGEISKKEIDLAIERYKEENK